MIMWVGQRSALLAEVVCPTKSQSSVRDDCHATTP